MPFPLCKIPKIRLDFSPVKNFLGKFLILPRPPPLLGNFAKLYLVINYDSFPKVQLYKKTITEGSRTK